MDWLTGSKQNEIKKLISQLADSNQRDSAAQSLLNRNTESIPLLIDALQTHDPNLLLIYQHLLARIPSATPELTKSLSTAQPIIRERVAEILGMKKDKSSISSLLDALKDPYYTVRSRAALALFNIGDSSIIPNLFPLLKDKEDEVRIAACTAIAKFNDPSAFDEIANVLFDDLKIEVRQAAASALGNTKNPAALSFLMEALRDSFWWYEREQNALDLLQAIQNMGMIAVELLIEALLDRERSVRKFSAMILGELKDDRAIEPLGMAIYDLHHEIGREAAESLAMFGSKSVDILIEALSHPEGMVRGHAVFALGKIQDIRVAPALIKMVADPDREVKKQTLQSLGMLRDDRAISALKEIVANRADREFSLLAKQILESKS